MGILELYTNTNTNTNIYVNTYIIEHMYIILTYFRPMYVYVLLSQRGNNKRNNGVDIEWGKISLCLIAYVKN